MVLVNDLIKYKSPFRLRANFFKWVPQDYLGVYDAIIQDLECLTMKFQDIKLVHCVFTFVVDETIFTIGTSNMILVLIFSGKMSQDETYVSISMQIAHCPTILTGGGVFKSPSTHQMLMVETPLMNPTTFPRH